MKKTNRLLKKSASLIEKFVKKKICAVFQYFCTSSYEISFSRII